MGGDHCGYGTLLVKNPLKRYNWPKFSFQTPPHIAYHAMALFY
jgi:hypothetical protein